MLLLNWIQRLLNLNSKATEKIDVAGTYKWLPVINQNYCTGCGECVKACEHNCIEMVWDFATLQRAADCGSNGNCKNACPENGIQMDWVLMEGDVTVGKWRTVENSEGTTPA